MIEQHTTLRWAASSPSNVEGRDVPGPRADRRIAPPLQPPAPPPRAPDRLHPPLASAVGAPRLPPRLGPRFERLVHAVDVIIFGSFQHALVDFGFYLFSEVKLVTLLQQQLFTDQN